MTATNINTPNDLLSLRDLLLALHTELLSYERQRYEKEHGRLQNTQEYFALVTENLNFAWLREISSLIVSLDELMASKNAISTKKIKDLLHYIQTLLAPNDSPNDFSRNYYQALQEFPAVGVIHGEIMKYLRLMIKQKV